MQLIKNLVKVPLNENEFLLVNTLNGLMDIVDKSYSDLLSDWESIEEITCTNEWEDEVFKKLLSRGYIIESAEIEAQQRETLMKRMEDRYLTEKDTIKSICFVLTYDCNFACPYCYEGNNPESNGVITETMVDRALELSGEEISHISFFGGEPLLPKTRKIVQYILSRCKDMSFSMITNGYYLEEFVDLFANIDITQIQVTLDGNRDTHDSKRYLKNHGSTFDKIISGVKACLIRGIPVKIRMNLNKDNFEECISLRDELMQKYHAYRDVLSFEMAPIFDFAGEERMAADKKLWESDMAYLHKSDHSINHSINTTLPITKCFTLKKRLKPIHAICKAHTSNRFYDADGNIYSCILAVGKEQFAVGTYYPEFQMKSESMLTRSIFTIEKCRDCKYAFICGGGCALGVADSEGILAPNCYSCMNELYYRIPLIYNSTKEELTV